MTFYAYMLRCSDGKYYVGHTDDLEVRLAQHQRGDVAGWTQKRRPVELVWCETFPTRDEAFAAERQIKGWGRAKKEALIDGDWERISALAKKDFSRTVLRYAGSTSSPATQDERIDGSQPPSPLILSSGLSEGEGRVSKDGSTSSPATQDERVEGNQFSSPFILSSGLSRRSRSEGRVSKDPAIILVRPQLGENIGKTARAMLNFGLTDLRLVAPRDGWPNPSAGPAASGADLVLERAQLFDTVAEAVADIPHIIATTVRKRDLVLPVVTPEQAARQMHERTGRSAILFGAERSGLETEEAALAQAILTVPINPEFRSLNLAQAVILVAYEWSKHQPLAIPTEGEEAEPRAPHAHLEGLIGQLDDALAAAGYFYPPDRTPATRNTIRTILTKPGWSIGEIRALRGIIRTLTHPRRRGKS